MNKIKIKNFKAFDNEVILNLDNKNLLLYGENGSGKSSLYEAIKIIFFRDKIESKLTAITPEDLHQLKNQLWSSFNNRNTNIDFEIEVNEENDQTFDASEYQVFMISIDELTTGDKLNLIELLKKTYFDISNPQTICETNCLEIQNGVNSALASFLETVSIQIDEEDNYSIKIIDSGHGLESKSELKRYFNEAKLNIIILLILLNVAKISQDTTKKGILVLDDFITSLDIANRTFIVNYIFEKFDNLQKLIFTHNISFYNLIMYLINDRNSDNDWLFSNLYEINYNHRFFIKGAIDTVQDIKTEYNNLITSPSPNLDEIGNRIRKKFEILLYEYSKLVMIGAVEDSKKILERINTGLPAYFKNKATASDLINEIETILSENNPANLRRRLKSKIDEFKYDEHQNFQKIVKELKLYQKVSMHPMSHGVIGMATFTAREIVKSLELLEKMEGHLKNLVNKDVATV